MQSSSEERCTKNNFCQELKIIAPISEVGYIQINYTLYIENLYTLLLNSDFYYNELCIMHIKFMHPSFEKGCIKINFCHELKIFAPTSEAGYI